MDQQVLKANSAIWGLLLIGGMREGELVRGKCFEPQEEFDYLTVSSSFFFFLLENRIVITTMEHEKASLNT